MNIIAHIQALVGLQIADDIRPSIDHLLSLALSSPNPQKSMEALTQVATSPHKEVFQVVLALVREIKVVASGDNERQNILADMSIDDLHLSTRTRNALWNNARRTVGAVAQLSEKEFLRMKNVGRASLGEVKSKLAPLGVELGRPLIIT